MTGAIDRIEAEARVLAFCRRTSRHASRDETIAACCGLDLEPTQRALDSLVAAGLLVAYSIRKGTRWFILPAPDPLVARAGGAR
jgi:hypothetical protein